MRLEDIMEEQDPPADPAAKPDGNFTRDEFNFNPPSSEGRRESGDGDSGNENRENPEATNKTGSNGVVNGNKKAKASKIPVRQVNGVVKKENGKSCTSTSDADPEPPIIEAPEEFRCLAISSPETMNQSASNRVHDNAPETGDTPQKNSNSSMSQERENEQPAPSIALGDAQCAQASGCSRASTAKVCDPAIGSLNLKWTFKNGRLVFDELPVNEETEQVKDKTPDSESSSDNEQELSQLSSKNLNKRTVDDSRSRLKYLEQKLKEAGIVDEAAGIAEQEETDSADNNKYDANQNLLIDLENGENFCQFDVRQVSSFPPSSLPLNCWEIYDELREESQTQSTSSSSSSEEDVEVAVTKMRDQSSVMSPENERLKHNPDRDNLKSLLKRPGNSYKKGDRSRSNRVVFNENKNEFFDADYIILIREECDYDDEEDEGVCTCNQHEMVRLTCCEPNCNCGVYEGFDDRTPQSPKFAPPLEFVDAVTLSPPEGYKDLGLEEKELLALQQMKRGQRGAPVCRECSVTHEEEEDGEGSQSDSEPACAREPNANNHEEQEEKEKTDQSQQTTPTTPPDDEDSPNSQRYILETITMTTVSEQRILREAEIQGTNVASGGSPINGILKGGRLWKQQSLEASSGKLPEPQQPSCTDSIIINSDEETSIRRSVRFTESADQSLTNKQRSTCDGASDPSSTEDDTPLEKTESTPRSPQSLNVSPESTEMMLTFKLGKHVLISNNSLKPNSAVRQLFPCTKPLSSKEEESIHQYLVTAESLKAFEEAKRCKLPQIIQSGETDESIKRAIERNTLRRSLIRYEPRQKRNVQKTDNSLVERIKQLTCDVDDVNVNEDDVAQRISPSGEESRLTAIGDVNNKNYSSSPSSSSTASSNSSSMSSTYKKITDLFSGGGVKRERPIQEQEVCNNLPDLGNGGSNVINDMAEFRPQQQNHHPIAKVNSSSSVNTDGRKQFLSSTLTACVSGVGGADENYYYHHHNYVADRGSVASSVGTEYSLEDIDEGLKNGEEEGKKIAPDVLAGTPSASESGDELAMFVQQDAGRIERIKKKYKPDQAPSKDDDDEHDDYGFNRRPNVRGIKPRFGSTTEILQQIQNQMQPPSRWPYYSESGLTNINHMPPTYPRPTSLQDETLYQTQRCVVRVNGNQGGYNYYQTLPNSRGRVSNGRPQSPPPLDMSKNYQTMVYIPYNHIEAVPQNYYLQGSSSSGSSDYVSNSSNSSGGTNNRNNQINRRYAPEPIYQQRIYPHHHHLVVAEENFKPMLRVPLQQHLIPGSRSESPLPGQFSTARSTQTPHQAVSGNNYYPRYPTRSSQVAPIYSEPVSYVTKMNNRHSFPNAGRYPPDNLSLTDSDSSQLSNGYGLGQNKDSSPVKGRFLERGVPEGAASIPVTDGAVGSPNSPPNLNCSNQKPMFYAMNV